MAPLSRWGKSFIRQGVVVCGERRSSTAIRGEDGIVILNFPVNWPSSAFFSDAQQDGFQMFSKEMANHLLSGCKTSQPTHFMNSIP